MGGAMAPVRKDDPLWLAWQEYQQTDEYRNTETWAIEPAHTEGSLWAAFDAAWSRAGGPRIHDGPVEEEHIMQFFAYDHLPPHLQAVSAPFCQIARSVLTHPRNPERTVALRKLLEAKDAAVRAVLAK